MATAPHHKVSIMGAGGKMPPGLMPPPAVAFGAGSVGLITGSAEASTLGKVLDLASSARREVRRTVGGRPPQEWLSKTATVRCTLG